MSKDIKITLLNPEETKKLFYDWGITSSVCYDTKTNKPEKIGQHCLKSGHTSGSRGTYIKFKIENVPRFTLDQLFRHEQGVFKNMGSFRYIGKNNFCYEIPQEILDNEDLFNQYQIFMEYCHTMYQKIQKYVYEKTNNLERANEQARYVLPMATHTACVIGFDVEAFIHLCHKRLCVRTEDVFRELTILLKEEVLKILPELKDKLVPQCQELLYCPESNSCKAYPNKKELLKIIEIGKKYLNNNK